MAELNCKIGNNEVVYMIFCNGQNVYCGEKDCLLSLEDFGKVHIEIKTVAQPIPNEKIILKFLKGILIILLSPIILLLMQILPLPSVDNYYLINKSYDLFIKNDDILLFSFISKYEQNKKYIDAELSINNNTCKGNVVFHENIDEIKQVKKEIKLLFLMCFIAGISISLIMIFIGLLKKSKEVFLLGFGVLLIISTLSVLGYMKNKR